MSLTSEMSRITGEFEAAQGARLAAVAKLAPNARRQGHRNETLLKGAMTAHRAATKKSLRDIFGTAAFARGAAEEMIEDFKSARVESASELREQLSSYVAELRETVSEELANLVAARTKMARRDENARRAQVKDLRARVEDLLADFDALIGALNCDRTRASRVWHQHLRNSSRQRRSAAHTAVASTAEPRARTARRTTKKRRHARA